MKRENNDGQVIPARCYCYTFANQLVRTNVATNQSADIYNRYDNTTINQQINR